MNEVAGKHSHPDERLERIREAALTVFNEKGYGSTTMADIARTSQVGIGTIYRRWPEKSALANDLYAYVLDTLRIRRENLATEDSAYERFMQIWRASCLAAEKNPDMFLFLEGQHHDAYIDARNRKKKNLQDADRKSMIDELGLTAQPEVIVAIVTGMLIQCLRNGTRFDHDDLGGRLWRAFTD